MSRVYSRMAGASEATKRSPSPRPTTSGEAFLAATISPGWRSETTAMAYEPSTCLSACRTASARVLAPARGGLVDQVGDDLGIGLRGERATRRPEAVAQGRMVLDDAVVHDGHGADPVRVGILIGRPSVRGPAGVADADRAGRRVLRQELLESGQLAPAAHHLGPVPIDDRHAR